MGGDGGCRVGEVRASTTSPCPTIGVLSYSSQIFFQKFSTVRVKSFSVSGLEYHIMVGFNNSHMVLLYGVNVISSVSVPAMC